MGRSKLKDGLEQAKKIANEREGWCLSKEYISSNKKLIWKCKFGHSWKAALSDIKKGTWCPECRSPVRETFCRRLLETIFKEPFPSYSPKWLKKEDGTNLYYDGFNEKLGLAFEHNGEQHYKQTKWFHKNEADFLNSKENDRIKKEISNKNGIFLLIIPYSVEFEKIPNFIIEELKKGNFFKIPEIPNPLKLQAFSKSNYNKLQEVCKKRNGKLLSEFWLGTHNKHDMECELGHKWAALYSNIMRGTWCPECKPERIRKANLKKDGIIFLNKLAQQNNGKVVFNSYTGVDSKYKWECQYGHIWFAAASDIKKGTWCSICNFKEQRDKIETFKKIAEIHDGKCLSMDIDYKNQKSKLLFECKFGHQWSAKAGNIKNKQSWCPICTKNKENKK